MDDEAILEGLFVESDAVLGACVVGADGAVRASRGPNVGALGSLGAALAVIGGRAVTELGRGAWSAITAEGDEGFVLLEPIDDERVVAVVASRGAAPGLVRSDVRAAIRGAREAA